MCGVGKIQSYRQNCQWLGGRTRAHSLDWPQNWASRAGVRRRLSPRVVWWEAEIAHISATKNDLGVGIVGIDNDVIERAKS